MGKPFPPRPRPPMMYYPIFPTILMLFTIVVISVWIHYTQAMIYAVTAALDVIDPTANADNFFVLSQSVVATSVLVMIYSCTIFGLCLWRAVLEAEIDSTGEVKDKVQLFQMANLGVRVCWWMVMTWLVVLLAGCAIFSVYVSNLWYNIKYTLANQEMVGGPPAVRGPYPDCPATCLDLWVIDYIHIPMDVSCVCDTATLQSTFEFMQDAKDAIDGCMAGVFFLYVVGGWWRSELSKQYAYCRKEQDVAGRLAAGSGAKQGSGGNAGGSGYHALGRGGGRAGASAGRGRGRGRDVP